MVPTPTTSTQKSLIIEWQVGAGMLVAVEPTTGSDDGIDPFH
jgi:hypothetical protein